jgi:hypothetical protein
MRGEAGLARRNMVGHGVAIGKVTAILRPKRDRFVGEQPRETTWSPEPATDFKFFPTSDDGQTSEMEF